MLSSCWSDERIFYTLFGVNFGWFLAFNSGNVILSAVGFLLGGFVMGERPGYGRKETAIGLIIAVIVYLTLKLTV